MRHLYITQEWAPYFSESGLGVTSNALPTAAHRRGTNHDLVLPYYPRLVRQSGLRTEEVMALPLRETAGRKTAATVHRMLDHGTPHEIFLIRSDEWYDRPGIYCDETYTAFADQVPRAAWFGRCVADWVARSGRAYDLVHGNDWQSGAAMAHLRHRFPDLPQLLTVHNALYEGDLRDVDLTDMGLPEPVRERVLRLAGGRPSMLLVAMWAADAAVTCSTGYAREVTAPTEVGPVAEAARRVGLEGVTFGVDPLVWDPNAPGRAGTPYSAAGVEAGKRANKAVLQRRLGLLEDDSLPLVGVSSRLVPEKGTDLLLEGLGPLIGAGRLQLVLVGPAIDAYRNALAALADRAPGHIVHVPRFEQEVAWLTYAGADLTVMPSRVEPGGLNQLIAYRYGTLPVVSPVGGLRDTVVDLRRSAWGTGFHIPEHTAGSVHDTVAAALEWMAADPGAVARVRRRVMAKDWSWSRTAQQYAEVCSRRITHLPRG